jgi:hypothetical protein
MNDTIITIEESKRLVALEATIKTGLATFMDVGNALAEIRDSRLYRIEHKTFEDYCREKWGMTDNYARRLISSAEVVKTVPIGTVTTESQARELAKVEPEHREQVVAAAVEATGGKITAVAIKTAALEISAPPQPTLSPEEPATTKKTRGAYKDWKSFRDYCGQIDGLCSLLEALRVDAAHAIPARDMSAKLSRKLQTISNTQ